MRIKDWMGWKGWARDIGIALVIGIIVLQFIRPIIVQEHSMEPTLFENDYLFLSKQAYRFGTPEHGDIIVFHTDLKDGRGRDKFLIKRVIGLPDDTLSIRDGLVYRNGNVLNEPYTMDGFTAGDMDQIRVPDGCVFAMGDNRNRSMDSRDPSVGFIPMEEIFGKVVFQVFPPSRLGKP
ncbi:MAG: signal peptidase I [Anaerovoracaceae bacterium]|jgi:signal peptidase I